MGEPIRYYRALSIWWTSTATVWREQWSRKRISALNCHRYSEPHSREADPRPHLSNRGREQSIDGPSQRKRRRNSCRTSSVPSDYRWTRETYRWKSCKWFSDHLELNRYIDLYWENLIDIQNLDAEISKYRQLLEGEENRTHGRVISTASHSLEPATQTSEFQSPQRTILERLIRLG